MTFVYYTCILFASFYFSQWTWNRACAMGGRPGEETLNADIFFALSVCAAIYGLRGLFGAA
jgi:hypothetical protein